MPAAPKKPAPRSVERDPEVVALAKKAQDHAKTHCGLSSSYLWREAAEFSEVFSIERAKTKVTISRKGCEPVETTATKLKAYAKTGADKDLARALRSLTKDTRLYGRKLAVFAVVSL